MNSPNAKNDNASMSPPRPSAGDVVLRVDGRYRYYCGALEIVRADAWNDVLPALEAVQRHLECGHHAAGFMQYEAAPGLDATIVTAEPERAPLLWFGIYSSFTEHVPQDPPKSDATLKMTLVPCIDESEYGRRIERIREYIAAGDTYQVNFAFPLSAELNGDPWSYFDTLATATQAPYAAYIDTGEQTVLSFSPELFFELDGNRLITRPMKGTRPRGRYLEEDLARKSELEQSVKDRAENLMIVDLLRNDMGRISDTGSVRVTSLFEIERYETVWQMTSTIESTTSASVVDIVRALFPSGSVTGAPKIRTSAIIHELESYPRGVYCGAIGFWGPGRRARFNVAIRTLTLDSTSKHGVYHVGSGITWDSNPRDEYAECLDKSRVLVSSGPSFELFETMLFDDGYSLLEEHLDRIERSARYFGFTFSREEIREVLQREAIVQSVSDPKRVRLTCGRDGGTRVDWSDLPVAKTFTIAVALDPVSVDDVFLFHKTTHRVVYDLAKQGMPDCDDVILWNTRGEVTESTIGNIVVEINGQRYTPPIDCGLLAGVMRRHLLETGAVHVRVLLLAELERATRIWIVNSLRGWVECSWAPKRFPPVSQDGASG